MVVGCGIGEAPNVRVVRGMDARELGEGLGEGAGQGSIGIAGALYTRTGETRRGLVREHEMQSGVPTIMVC